MENVVGNLTYISSIVCQLDKLAIIQNVLAS
jgi:hypothetical protein